jgi:hypothetical protein
VNCKYHWLLWYGITPSPFSVYTFKQNKMYLLLSDHFLEIERGDTQELKKKIEYVNFVI